MKRWLWILAAIFISTLVYSTIRYGLRPKPIPVLNPTEFEDLQQIGAVVYKRLRQNIRPERLIVLGSSRELAGYENIWLGFLKTASADQVKIDVFFQHEGVSLPADIGGWETLPFNESMVHSGDLVKLVRDRLQVGHLVVVHGLSEEVSHLIKDSLSRQLDEVVHHPVLSLSTLPVSSKANDAEAVNPDCLNPAAAPDGLVRFECAKARVAKAMLKKRLAEDKIWGVMERHGLQEYLIFVRIP
jgi:hypothetical protein